MKRLFTVLLMLLMFLSACSSDGYVTEPDIPDESRSYHYTFDMLAQSRRDRLFPAASADDGTSGRIYFGIDANGNAFLIGGTEPSAEVPSTPAEETPAPAEEETSASVPAVTSAEETLPEATTEEPVPETLPAETTEEPSEPPEETTEESSSETLPEETETEETSEEETTEEETTPEETTEEETTAKQTAPPPTTKNNTQNTTQSYYGKTWNWVDVDLTAQRVTVYSGDTVIGSFPCVTGCIAEGWGTPTGQFYIRSKERNRTLNGNSNSFVKYWMPFYRDYGLHDASWRNGNFRSDHAWYYGSHGCVNLSEEAAKFIWDHCSTGDTVIVRGAVKDPGIHRAHDLSGSWIVEKEATCTEAGKKIKKCPYCYGIASEQKIPATGHKWGEWKTVSGVRQRVCSACGITETEGQHLHNWSEWTSVDDKIHSRSCKDCGDTQKESHSFESVVTPATETERGYTTYTCTECGYSYKDNYTDVHIHAYGPWVYSENNTHSRICTACGEGRETESCTFGQVVVTAPTETSAGYTTYTCTVCGYSYQDDFTDPLPHTHSWGIWTSNNNGTHSRSCTGCSETDTGNCSYTDEVIAPTESSQGYTRHTCTVCGYSYKDSYTDPIHTHSFGSWSSNNDGTHSRSCSCGETQKENCSYTDEVIAPTESSQGYTKHTCTVCGYSYKDSYTDPIHTHSFGSWTSNNDGTHSRSCGCGETQKENCSYTDEVIAPTESSQGYTKHTCTVCSYSYTDSYTDPIPHNHSWGSWASNGNGTHSHSCQGCSETETQNCSYTDEVIAPTESSQGYTKHTCTVCGYSYTDSYTDPIPHNHSWGSWASNGNGTHSHSCQGCSETETQNCSYTDTVIPPTESSEGYTRHTCTVCGYYYDDNFVPPVTEPPATTDPDDGQP